MRKYEITKEQINEYVEQHPCCGATKQTLQDLFPDAFKPEFQVGKWYKSHIGTLSYYSGEERMCGVSTCGQWNDTIITKTAIESCCYGVWTIANKTEIYDALKREAIKRGFKENDVITDIHYSGTVTLNSNEFDISNNNLWLGDCVLFKNGEWVCKAITKSEAEKQLGIKIID